MGKFDSIPVSKPKRGNFRLGNMHTTTLDFGRLQPAKIFECVPNDVVSIDMQAYCQAAPNPSPINGKLVMSAHAFFVPTRILATEWNNYILGLSTPTLPYITGLQLKTGLTALNVLGQHVHDNAIRHLSSMGIPKAYYDGSMDTYKINALPFRAFNRVWFDWYRDKMRISDANLSSYCYDTMGACTQSEVTNLISQKSRCFAKDYITTAFDHPSSAGILSGVPISHDRTGYKNTNYPNFEQDPSYNATAATGSVKYGALGVGSKAANAWAQSTNGNAISNTGTSWNYPQVAVRNLSDGSIDTGEIGGNDGTLNFNIPQLRGAAAYQRYLERLLVSGKSVIARLKSIFGATDTPERLQMSEYLGGTSKDFSFENYTAPAAGSNGAGGSGVYTAFGSYGPSAPDENMPGQKTSCGTCTLEFGNITYHAKEHGFILIVTSIMPVVANYQGLDRMWLRGVATGTCSRFDYFTPDMENVGFEPILMSEVVTPSFNSGTNTSTYDPLSIFGWTQRYMSYKYAKSLVSGDFVNPNTAVSLQSFHLGRNILRELGFANADGSVATNPPSSFSATVTPESLVACDYSARQAYDDKFTVSSSDLDHFIVNYKFDVIASRPMEENAMPCIDDTGHHDVLDIPTGGVRL